MVPELAILELARSFEAPEFTEAYMLVTSLEPGILEPVRRHDQGVGLPGVAEPVEQVRRVPGRERPRTGPVGSPRRIRPSWPTVRHTATHKGTVENGINDGNFADLLKCPFRCL